jgi:hypothetical protein
VPDSPAKLCRDCSSRALAGTSYCSKHQRQNNHTEYRKLFDRYRADDPIRLLYRVLRWTGPYGTRLTVLRRDMLCQWPEGCPHAATVVDHHPLEARAIVAQLGVDAFYDPSRSRGLCKAHHDAKTAREQGFAQRT